MCMLPILLSPSLSNIQKVGPISFCRRRLPVVMVRSGMVERLETAVKFVEQGIEEL